MRIWIISTVASACILLVWAGCAALAQHRPPSDAAHAVQLDCDTPILNSYDLIDVLAEATRKNKAATQFRVTWGDRLGGGSNDGTCLYDRSQGVLRYYDLTGYLFDAGWRPTRRMYYIFSKVNDAKLRQVNRLPTATKIKPHILPTLLVRVGCVKRVEKITTYKPPRK